MAYQRIVGISFLVCDSPNLDSLVERGASEHGRVLGVDGYLHDVVIVVLISIDLLPTLVPIK
jgi:hypothetical protein